MSIMEVSKLAGVSPTTVSRVLNNHPHVSDRTVNRIRKAMRQLKYRPRPYGTLRRTDESGRPEMNRKLAVFALILPEVRSGFYPTLIESFTSEAESLNHQVMTCCTHNDVGRQANAILQLMDHQVAGVALVPATVGSPPGHHVRQLQKHNVPVVFLHRGVPDVAAPLVWLDHEQVGRLAATRLIEMGHHRVAIFCTHRTNNPNPYLNGLKLVYEQAGYAVSDELIHYGPSPLPTMPKDREAEVETPLRRMLAMPAASRPTAIFCSFDPYGEAVYMALSKLGVDVPREISIVSVGGTFRNGAITHRLTSVTVDEVWAGRTTVQWLREMGVNQRRADEACRISIPLRWHEGETLAAAHPPGVRHRKKRVHATRSHSAEA